MTDVEKYVKITTKSAVQERVQATDRRLGLLGGALIGLGVALGALGQEALSFIRVPTSLSPFYLILGAVVLMGIGGLAGWLAARIDRAFFALLIWLAAAIASIFVIGHLPYEGRAWGVWLADSHFAGLPIFPFSEAAQTRMVIAGFFIVIALAILGLTQAHRLESARGSFSANQRPSAQTLLMLVFPLAIAAGAGLFADSTVNAPLRTGNALVHEAIRTGRTYQGDLFALSRASSVNYNAIAGVRDQMSANYVLQTAEADFGTAQTVYVVAHFDNGAWINCRVLADQLSNCYDARPPYTDGFEALIVGRPVDACARCAFRVSGALHAWLRARADRFAGAPRISRLAQWGSHVLMRAESPDGGYTIECRFHGISPISMESCEEIGS